MHQLWKNVPPAAELATAGVIAAGLLLAGVALGTHADPPLGRLRGVLWLLSTGSAAAFVAVVAGKYLHLGTADGALATSAAALVYAIPLWWRNRSALQHLAAFGTALALVITCVDRIDPNAGPFAYGIAIWVFALAWGIAAFRSLLPPASVGVVLSGGGTIVGAIIAMDNSAGTLLAIATLAGLFAVGIVTHRVALIGIGAVGSLYVVPDAASTYLPGSVAAPLAAAVVGLVLLGVALWLARQRINTRVGRAANGDRGTEGQQPG